MDIAGLVPSDRHVDGVVEMLLDATQHYQQPLAADRLFGWHSALFPSSRRGMRKADPMQVVSGAMGKEKIHFEAPDTDRLEEEMRQFISWFNEDTYMDPIIKAAIAHLRFVTVHPFDYGNGRIARAIADMQLARADESAQRFYSMSAQIRKERKEYYEILESTQKGSMNITNWLDWFLQCLDRALEASSETLASVLKKASFWEKHATTSLNQRQRLMLNKLLDGFEGKLNTSKWAKITKTSSDTALRDIQGLVAKGILEKEVGGRRSTSYCLME
ncbi:Fic family protein [Flavihumibacter sp. RY-1]|uniref:Fic family protein n=1 Tax=Flavihumibacter fluminis TaxID=2909236 RepID=A0ABS9BK75_9BACT|nr:Fic family protein [Flavihumibacter fluminis]MCF1715403.1 Fic family protein [Flavihumibacter fluminis]